MRALAIQRHGDESALERVDLQAPKLGPNRVLIAVRAVALNHLDLWVRRGWPGLKLSFPHVLGSDVAGVIEAVGSEVTDLAPGTKVVVNPGVSCGWCEKCLLGEDNLCRSYQIVGEHVWGGYAEYLAVPRPNILPMPEGLSFEEAACLPLTFLTAWTMLARRARIEPGDTVLVQAGGSGVGSAAIQIAKLLGATVIATASTEQKLKKAQSLGADHLINYREKGFVDEVKRITGRRMVDVVVEHVGGQTFEQSVACLPYGGKLVTCGATAGHEARIDLRVLFYKRLSLLGSTMGSKGDLFRLLKLVGQKKLRPVLDRVLPLAEAPKAHRLLEERSQFGHLVLTP